MKLADTPPPPIRTCEFCGGLFRTLRKKARFCCTMCERDAEREKDAAEGVRHCKQCGTKIPRKGREGAAWQKVNVCSSACRDAFAKSPEGRALASARRLKNLQERRDEEARRIADLERDLPPAEPPLPLPQNAPIDFSAPPTPAAEREYASRVLARRSLLHFTKRTHPNYSAGWVHQDICKRLERFSRQVAERKSPRLMLLVPPRHGKSELASIRFPAWHLGHYPDHEFIDCGYNLDLPMRFSRKVREIIRDPLYAALFSGTKLDPEAGAAEAWNTTMGGGFKAAGVGGGITGTGAHVLVVDDPIKNMEEADSALVRDSLWDWYLSTAYTRLAPGGGVLVIETWWNDDDLAGRLQNAMRADPLADQFEIIKYPALAEHYEFRHRDTMHIVRAAAPELSDGELLAAAVDMQRIYGRERTDADLAPEAYEFLRAPGDALHPDRYDGPSLRRIRANQTPRIWSALYQQNPVPDAGLYFRQEYFRYTTRVPEVYGRNIYSAWDFAIGEKQANDYTVGATMLHDVDNRLYVLDIVRFKGDAFTIIEEILNVAERWGTTPGTPYMVGFEDGQIFRALEPSLKARMQERLLHPSYEILRPLTDKQARARALQGRMQQGRVYFPEDARWRKDTEFELLRFPGGAHDDIVDALAWCTNLVVGKAPPRARDRETVRGWRDKLASMGEIDGSHMAA